MDKYKSAAKQYIDNDSICFTSSKKKKGKTKISVGFEQELYSTHYDLLSKEDKKDFMDGKTEHMSEYDNMRRFDL